MSLSGLSILIYWRFLLLMDVAVIVVTHGSRRSVFVDDVAELADFLAAHVGLPVYLAHNEYAEPNWRAVFSELVDRGIRRVVFALAFLGRGNHVARDVMGELGVSEFGVWREAWWRGRRVEVFFTRPLSDSHLVRAALLHRVLQAVGRGLDGAEVLEDPLEIHERSLGVALELAAKRLPEAPAWVREVAAYAVYASGNPELAGAVYASPGFFDVFRDALRAGLPVLTDVKMVAAGIRWGRVENYLDDVRTLELSRRLGITRTAAAMRVGLDKPKIVVVGNAPTALFEVLRLVEEGVEVPAVVAAPPGFTNAVEAKEACVASGIPCLAVRGTCGGSNVAVAMVNRLIELAYG